MTYTWTIGGGAPQTTTANSYTTGSLSASAAYSVKVKNAYNCESNTANGNITVQPLPVITTTGPDPRCGAGTVTLTATASGSTTTAMTYTWTIDGTSYTTTANSYATGSIPASDTYSVKVKNANNCESNTASGTITVHPLPVITTTSPAAICSTGEVALTATASGGTTTAMTYTWIIDGEAETVTTTTGNYTACSLPAGTPTYSVTLTNANGCISAAATGTITVQALPTLTLTTANNTQSINSGLPVTAIKYTTANASGATVTGLPAGVSGNWAANTLTISGTPSAAGIFNYTVSTTNGIGCPSQTASGTLTVYGSPPGAGTNTYACGAQTWSGPVRIADCDHDEFTNDPTAPHCRSDTWNSIKYYYYNWAYVNANKNTMCPYPWHVPSNTEFTTLRNCLGTSGANGKYYPESSTWGGARAGYANGSSMDNVGSYGDYWSSTEYNTNNAYYMYFNTSSAYAGNTNKSYGLQVRCVRNN
jgi:uncharacterized protein (TIGR02145 family)